MICQHFLPSAKGKNSDPSTSNTTGETMQRSLVHHFQPRLVNLAHRWNSLIRAQAALRLHNRMTKYCTIVAALLHDDPRLPRQFRQYARELSLREAREACFNHLLDWVLLVMQFASVIFGPLSIGVYYFSNPDFLFPPALTTLTYLPLFTFLSMSLRNWANEPVHNHSYTEETYLKKEEAQLLPTFAEADNRKRETYSLFAWFAAITLIALIWMVSQPLFSGAGQSAYLFHTLFGYCMLIAAFGWSGSVLFINSVRGLYNNISETLFALHPIVQLVDSTLKMLHRLGDDLFIEENRWGDIAFRNRAYRELNWIISLLKMPSRRFASSKGRHAQIINAIQAMQNEIDKEFSTSTPQRLHDVLSELFIHSTLGTMGTLKANLAKAFPDPTHDTR
jgi:hypothetical protein